jgi:hypothetical protein
MAGLLGLGFISPCEDPEYKTNLGFFNELKTQIKIQPETQKPIYINTDMYNEYAGGLFKGSTDLNMACIEYFYTGLPFYKQVLFEKAKNLIGMFTLLSSLPQVTEAITVYHGTDYSLHEGTNHFNTFAFLSTTLSKSIAKSYCIKQESCIYRIKIPQGFPYIILDQSNLQILLPIATKILITRKCPEIEQVIKNEITYIYKIYDATLDIEYTKTIEYVKQTFDKYVLQPIALQLTTQKHKYLLDFEDFTKSSKKICLRGSSTLYLYNKDSDSSEYGKSRSKNRYEKDLYIIKDTLKKRDLNKEIKTDDYIIRRIINELLSSLIYKEIYGCATFEYYLVKRENLDIKKCELDKSKNVKYFIGSKFIEQGKIDYDYKSDNSDSYNLNICKEILGGFIVDCIMSNWDIYNNNNIGILDNNKVVRTDVGGALAYRGIGDIKVSFFNNYTDIKDHITFFTDTRNNAGKYLNVIYNKLNNKLNKLKEEEIGNIIYAKAKSIKNINTEYIYNKVVNQDTVLSLFQNSEYQQYIYNIIDIVVKRHNWYISNQTSVIQSFMESIKKPSSTTGGSNPKKSIKYNGLERKVHIKNKNNKYIIVNKKEIYLKNIKGKYKYIQKGGTEPECTEEVKEVETIMYDIITHKNPLETLTEIKRNLSLNICRLKKLKIPVLKI